MVDLLRPIGRSPALGLTPARTPGALGSAVARSTWLQTAPSGIIRERSMSSDCLFCRIVAGELSVAQVYSDDTVVAIRDIAPQAPTHILLLSRKPVSYTHLRAH